MLQCYTSARSTFGNLHCSQSVTVGLKLIIFWCWQWRAFSNARERTQDLALEGVNWDLFLTLKQEIIRFRNVTKFFKAHGDLAGSRHVKTYFTLRTNAYIRPNSYVIHICITMNALKYSGYCYYHKKTGKHPCTGIAIYLSVTRNSLAFFNLLSMLLLTLSEL